MKAPHINNHFIVRKKDETVEEFAKATLQKITFKSLRHFAHYDVEEGIRDSLDEGESHDSIVSRWGKHSVFRMWEEAYGHRYLCGAVVARKGELDDPGVEFGGWAMACTASVMIGQDEQVDLAITRDYHVVEVSAHFETTMLFLLEALMNRPTEFRLSRGERTPLERAMNKPAIVTISLSKPIIRTIGCNGLGGGWKMPEHDVRGHERHYKSGKVVWIEGHKRGDPKVARKTTYRVIP